MKTDYQIQKDIMEELLFTPFLQASEIGVAVHEGIVTLSGIVDSYSKKLAAGKAANRVKGTKAVALNIDVRPGAAYNNNDAAIAKAILDALKWHSDVKEDTIKIKVDDGWVTLEGEAEWEYQRASAVRVAGDILGVRGVTNLIRITPKVTKEDIRKKIKDAFLRSATIDAERIKIKNVDGTVTLSGKVSSLTEKTDAATAAWFAPGVVDVDNQLEVESDALVF